MKYCDGAGLRTYSFLIFCTMLVTKQLLVATDWQPYEKLFGILWKSKGNRNWLVINILLNIFFRRIEEFVQVWNNRRVSKLQKFHFWVNYPLKIKNKSPSKRILLSLKCYYTTMVLQKMQSQKNWNEHVLSYKTMVNYHLNWQGQ